MERDAKDWVLQSVKTLYAVSDKNCVKVKFQFTEAAPKGYVRIPIPDKYSEVPESERTKIAKYDASLKDRGVEITSSDWSLWKNIDGIWYAREIGISGHMSLNAGLAVPEM